MKKCFKCEQEKPLSEFYKHPKMADGRLGKCKDCTRSDSKENRSKNIDYYLEYDKSRYLNPNRVKGRLEYQKTERGRERSSAAKKRWIENNVVKRGAHVLVGNAIKSGVIVKPDICSCCGITGKLSAHHDDYNKPLEVRWLCSLCHRRHHKQNPAK